MTCTEAYKEHIEYTFNAFCKVVIRYAAINAWRNRNKRRQREISLEYLAEEKFYPFCTLVSAEKRIKGSQNQGMQMETGKKRGKSVQEARECGIMKGAKNGVL